MKEDESYLAIIIKFRILYLFYTKYYNICQKKSFNYLLTIQATKMPTIATMKQAAATTAAL